MALGKKKGEGWEERRKELSGFLNVIATPSKKEFLTAEWGEGGFPSLSLLLACQRFRRNKTPERTFTTECFQSAGDVTTEHAEKRSDSRLGKRENRYPRGDGRKSRDSDTFPLARVTILHFRTLITGAVLKSFSTVRFSFPIRSHPQKFSVIN